MFLTVDVAQEAVPRPCLLSLPQERKYGHECDPLMLSTNVYPTFTFRDVWYHLAAPIACPDHQLLGMSWRGSGDSDLLLTLQLPFILAWTWGWERSHAHALHAGILHAPTCVSSNSKELPGVLGSVIPYAAT